MLRGKRRSCVVVCALFFITKALPGQAISVRAQGADQDSEKTGVSLIVPAVPGGLRATTAQEQTGPAESKHWKFAVVSVRKNNSGGPQHIGVTTADGYQMKNLFLGYLLLMAYVPQTGGGAFYSPDQFIGMPAWLTGDDDHYDVDAKVDEADLADWQNPAKQPGMLRSMLQAMLEDRLKLVVHRSTREAPVYLLLVGKNGPNFKETNPGEIHPGARPMLATTTAQDWDRAKTDALVDESLSREPGYFYIARVQADNLLPKWYGEPGDTEQFVAKVADRIGGAEGDATYFFVSEYILTEAEKCIPCSPPTMSWERLRRGYAAIEYLYGTNNFEKNAYAFLAVHAGDRETARRAFERVGDNWNPDVWGSKARFESGRLFPFLKPVPLARSKGTNSAQ